MKINNLYTANGPYWRPGERHDQQCGLLSLSAKDWITAACSEKHPYICFQLPADSKYQEISTLKLVYLNFNEGS